MAYVQLDDLYHVVPLAAHPTLSALPVLARLALPDSLPPAYLAGFPSLSHSLQLLYVGRTLHRIITLSPKVDSHQEPF